MAPEMHGFPARMVFTMQYHLYISPICNFRYIRNWGGFCRNITIDHAAGAQPGGSVAYVKIVKIQW